MDNDNHLARWLEDELSEAEKATLKQDEDYTLLEQIRQYSSQLTVASTGSDENVLENITSLTKPDSRVVHFYRTAWFKVAASVLVLFAIGLIYTLAGRASVYSNERNNLTFELPDASKVSLATQSVIKFNKSTWPINRSLQLEGEAFFNVAKGRKFTVTTSAGDIQVLGTRFNVANRSGGLEVECYEGRVEVSAGDSKTIIVAGQSVTLAGKELKHNDIFISGPRWAERQLAFRSTTLRGVLVELQKTYQIEIERLPLTEATGKLFTGALPTENLEVAINIIEKAFSVKCVKITDRRFRLVGQTAAE